MAIIGNGAPKAKNAATAATGNVQKLSRIASCAVMVALLALVLGAYMFYTSTTILAAIGDQMTRVVVAQNAMETGHIITSADVAVKEIAKDAAADGALTDAGQAVGKRVEGYIARGAALTPGALAGDEAATAAGRVAEGHVAISVAVSQQSGVAGLVRQGDAVSVLAAASGQGEETAAVVAQHARVLALDSNIDGYSPDYTAITLDVEPASAQKIAAVSSSSQLTVVLEPGRAQKQ